MSAPWLIIDTHYMGYRALYTTGEMMHDDIPTGVIYGFLRDVLNLCEQFQTNRVVFCFDSKTSKRKAILPTYKISRERETDPEKIRIRAEMREQLTALRRQYLPNMGFTNIFQKGGYEADDLIASVCIHSIPKGDEVIVVSADKDLYQLLSGTVQMYNPTTSKYYTLQSLMKEYGITPQSWATVKAIAGCAGDDVPGVKGVGDKTAAKYIRGELSPTAVTRRNINEAHAMINDNKALVKLPFAGTPMYELTPTQFSMDGWNRVTKTLGLKSIQRINELLMTGKQNKRKGLGLI
jgi:DNA polymerase-1